MSLLTMVLFLLGLGFLFLGWRWQSPQDKELLAALKGLVQLKHELTKVKDNLQVLEKKVDSQDVKLKQRPEFSGMDDPRVYLGKNKHLIHSSEEIAAGSEWLMQNNALNWKENFEATQGLHDSLMTLGLKDSEISTRNLRRYSQYNDEPLEIRSREEVVQTFIAKGDSEKSERSSTLPEKYLKALELANAGLSVREIANHLMLSQDAVSLVLSTYPKGGRT